MCRKTMDLAAAERKWSDLHHDRPFHDGDFTSWSKERTDSHPYHFQDGVRLWVSDVDYDPDGSWLSARESQQGPERKEGDESA